MGWVAVSSHEHTPRKQLIPLLLVNEHFCFFFCIACWVLWCYTPWKHTWLAGKSPLSIGNTSTHSWWIFQPLTLVFGGVNACFQQVSTPILSELELLKMRITSSWTAWKRVMQGTRTCGCKRLGTAWNPICYFNWMISNLCTGNGWKSPFPSILQQTGWFGFLGDSLLLIGFVCDEIDEIHPRVPKHYYSPTNLSSNNHCE